MPAQARHDEAVAGYERALALKGDHAPAHNALGSLLMSMGRAADAVAHFQQAIRSDPRLTDAYLNLGSALLRHGKLFDALGVINRTFELGLAEARAADALDLVRQALEIEDSVDTRTLFVQCVRNLPTVPDAGGIRGLMIRALTEPWGRPADLSAAATSLIVQAESGRRLHRARRRGMAAPAAGCRTVRTVGRGRGHAGRLVAQPARVRLHPRRRAGALSHQCALAAAGRGDVRRRRG